MATTIEAQTVEYLYRPVRNGKPVKRAKPVKRGEAHFVICKERSDTMYKGGVVYEGKSAQEVQQKARALAKKRGAKLLKYSTRQQVVV